MTLRDAVELFHLQFLRVLCAGPDRELFIVKGGLNLRFFFGSVRYSEDIDLDVAVTSLPTLKKRIDKLLASPALQGPLAAKGLRLSHLSAPKQTETTQRWKIGLEGDAVAAHTKIEFSRRAGKPKSEEAHVDAVGAEIARRHGLLAPLVCHYRLDAAVAQKLGALVGRASVQARDLFDLHVLLAKAPELVAKPKDRAAALDRVTSISWADFTSQVVAYLEPEQQELWRDRASFEQLQLEVLRRLEAA